MTLVLPNSFGIVTSHWIYVPLNRQMSCTFGFFDTAGTNGANAAAASYRNQITAVGGPANPSVMSTEFQHLGCTVLMRTTAGLLINGSDPTVVTGTVSAPANLQPVFLPYVVTKRTAFAGKHYQGRFYPPFTVTQETAIDAGGGLLPATVAALQAQWTSVLVAVNAGPYPMYLLHSAMPGVPAPTSIIGMLVRPVVGVQRRRRNRGA